MPGNAKALGCIGNAQQVFHRFFSFVVSIKKAHAQRQVGLIFCESKKLVDIFGNCSDNENALCVIAPCPSPQSFRLRNYPATGQEGSESLSAPTLGLSILCFTYYLIMFRIIIKFML
jgi:hypothetical protein